MSSPHRSVSPDMRQTPSSRRRVVTVPSWARNLPPEFPDDEYDDAHTISSSSGRPSGARRMSLGSLFRPPHSSIPITTASGPNDANSDASTSSTPLTGPDDSKPRPPPLSFQPSSVQRPQASSNPHTPGDKWWTFTLPSKYLEKVNEYVHHTTSVNEPGSAEKGKGPLDDDRRSHRSRKDKDLEKEAQRKHMTMTANLAAPTFSMNQPEARPSFRSLAFLGSPHRH
ncbi:hypothetical protein RQP46_003034 [Phenoliferia psychrophenolica]